MHQRQQHHDADEHLNKGDMLRGSGCSLRAMMAVRA
jgi:hypothetical protein